MWPDRVSNPGPLTYESGTLLTALRGPAHIINEDRNQSTAELQWLEQAWDHGY